MGTSNFLLLRDMRHALYHLKKSNDLLKREIHSHEKAKSSYSNV
jgi:hypothetical protein